MKANKKIVLTLVAGFIFAFSGIVYSNGNFPLEKSPYDKTNASIIDAKFTIMKYEKQSSPIEYGCRVTAILNNPKTQKTKPFYCELENKISKKTLCQYKQERLLSEFIIKCDDTYETIPTLFGLDGKPYITNINFDIPKACENITKENPSIVTGTCTIRIENGN